MSPHRAPYLGGPDLGGPDLRAWADRNEAAGYACLVRNSPDGRARTASRFGGCTAFWTGRWLGFFNPVLVVEPTDAVDVRRAIDWLRERGAPLSLRIRADLESDAIRAVATDAGLERDDWAEPAMVLWPLRPAPALPAGLAITAAGPESIEAVYQAAANAFENIPDGLGFFRNLVPAGMLDDPDVRFFGATLDGDPVACSLAIRSGPIVGVYSVGTASRARRRGIATALTSAAIEAGRAWGCEAATLQASAMGEPVYRAMGFETVGAYVTWSEPEAGDAPQSQAEIALPPIR
jgi:GNAT superfamily N-acetyltransferase